MKKLHSFKLVMTLFAALVISSQLSCAQTTITPDEARAIAKEAYLYGYPMVDGYRIMHAYFVNRESPEFKGRWNQLHHIPR
ncbi:MAG: cell envelope protein, partial [Gammaproteobacteria bacterium]